MSHPHDAAACSEFVALSNKRGKTKLKPAISII